ncbi:prenyltransferase/squalene oxidase repeat-containing protein [Paenibacillus sp. R14(2021)]|uniref:terpene cyclase/mutase family protein n=1 Tax=Paenibacillus sp. R14(2021) TaxID=2859228 RepID=UPI001C613663|nr:prenyltransferase/squalene oxidase repeat-containing protein [Paenibacillus sp. R14(2021)]
MRERIQSGIDGLTQHLLQTQASDGSWRMGFIEGGTSMDAAAIMLLQSAGIGRPKLVRDLADRIWAKQSADGAWRIHPDEQAGHASATAECYIALQYAGVSPDEPRMKRAADAFAALGGLSGINCLLTKFLLATIGQYDWPRWFPIPISIMLLPQASPVHFYQFSGYARVHMAPMLLIAHLKPDFKLSSIRPLPEAARQAMNVSSIQQNWDAHFRPLQPEEFGNRWKELFSIPSELQARAVNRAERYMLERIEPDGTLYSYASTTILMVHALRALGLTNDHPLIADAIRGLESLLFLDAKHGRTMQITTSTLWDTALISGSLQAAGLPSRHPALQSAGRYILDRQHEKLGDWKLNVKTPTAGGWGFSDVNTRNPDVDDTTAALRAVQQLETPTARHACDLGLQWLLSMQNSDGGWAAFERNINNPLISWVPLDGAEDAATDPSTPDLTGRTLEYLGRHVGLTSKQPFVRRAADWLFRHQEPDGSWYGRWGVCYIYGTWAALTGLLAVQESARHPQIQKAAEWLLSIQLQDGGFGESCSSDRHKQFIPLPYGTLAQTAWALDALTAVHEQPLPAMEQACDFLLRHLGQDGKAAAYPTGAGLPGYLYSRYDSYGKVWPLLALANYQNKFGGN